MKCILAIEGGGTRTVAALYHLAGDAYTLLGEISGKASNPVESGIANCVSVITSLAQQLTREPIDTVAAGISGVGRLEFRMRVAHDLCAALHAECVRVTNDLHPLLIANAKERPGILAIAGTGSSILGRTATGAYSFTGGRGRVFGDDGSAYQIAVSALRAAAAAVDSMGPETRLVADLPKAAGVSAFADLVLWTASAGKQELAALAQTVEALASTGDTIAHECVVEQASRLAAQVQATLRRLALPPDTTVFVHGALFERSTLYRKAFTERLIGLSPSLSVQTPALRGPRAVAELVSLQEPLPDWLSECSRSDLTVMILPATERADTGTKSLDHLTAIEVVHRMNQEDATIADTVMRSADAIAEAIERVRAAIVEGGRLIYVGAGTSGRLGVLDAAECPPTFGIDPNRVVGLIAGGETALRNSVEGAEDDRNAALADITALQPPVNKGDVVVGIAASGRTPYTLAAIEEARRRGAATALISCNPVEPGLADIPIGIETGPEILPGSTRLKAGTATKMVLNMISTGALALAGYVYDGCMVGMRPINDKLYDRAARIVATLTGLDRNAAGQLLDSAEGRIGVAVLMARHGLPVTDAARRLEEAGGVLREALRNV